jgi:hypothetical protein
MIVLLPTVTINCACGKSVDLEVIDADTSYDGMIWQGQCECRRSFTLEVANDPDLQAAIETE